MKFTNIAGTQISSKTQLLNQINLITKCKDNNITKYLRDLLQPRNNSEIYNNHVMKKIFKKKKKISKFFN